MARFAGEARVEHNDPMVLLRHLVDGGEQRFTKSHFLWHGLVSFSRKGVFDGVLRRRQRAFQRELGRVVRLLAYFGVDRFELGAADAGSLPTRARNSKSDRDPYASRALFPALCSASQAQAMSVMPPTSLGMLKALPGHRCVRASTNSGPWPARTRPTICFAVLCTVPTSMPSMTVVSTSSALGTLVSSNRRMAGAAAGAPIIIFHPENHRQLPELGDVQRFVKHAFFHGAVAEEDHGDSLFTFDLSGVSGAAGEREAAADDGGGMNDADFGRGDVKRPGAALAVAGGAADDLGQDFLGVAALGDDMAVVAMGGEDIIVFIEPVANRNAGGFLADVNMKMAAHQAGVFVVEADAMFFGAPDHQHLAQDSELLFSGNLG